MKNISGWQSTKYNWSPDGTGNVRSKGVGPGSFIAAYVTQRALAPLIRKYLSGRVADVGAGNVPFYPCYRENAESIVCIDWGKSAHDSARHSDVLADLNEAVPLPDESIDSALMTSVLEHIAKPDRLLSELHRILVPSGRLIIEVPFCYWLHEEPHDHYRYTEFALRRLSREAGFEVEYLAAYGNALIVMVDVASKTAMICMNRLGRYLPSWRLQRLWYSAVRLTLHAGQHLISLILARGPLAQMLEGSTLQSKIPLGYIVVLRRTP